MDHLPQNIVRLGTRGSPLALIQTQRVKTQLQAAYPDLHIETIIIATTGDKDLKTPLSEMGGKNVFIRELEQALLDNTIDVAVHSLKDVTSSMAPGLSLVGCLAPETNRDAWVSRTGFGQDAWNPARHIGAMIGTGSARRRALIRTKRTDWEFRDVRGNVGTRLKALDQGDVDALMLSEAGLRRLQLTGYDIVPITDPAFLPAPGQGVIALQARNNDPCLPRLITISDPNTLQISHWEWQVLAEIGFDCRIPLGMETTLDPEGNATLSIFLADPQSSRTFRDTLHFTIPTAQAALAQLTTRLIAQIQDWT